MDIELLSKMVKELIMDNDRVTLPGMGAFVAEMVPATFSDRGYTINPPYRRLGFRSGKKYETDTLLVDLYASANKIDGAIAEKVITEFVAGLAEEVKSRKSVAMPGLGRLRATRENAFFFVSDEDLDIYPEGFGLEPLSLKSHSKPTSFDFSELDAPAVAVAAVPEPAPAEGGNSAVSSAAETQDNAASPAVAVAAVTEPEPAPAPAAPEGPKWWLGEEEEDEDEEESVWDKKWFIVLFVILCLMLLAAILFGLFLLLAHVAPDFIDRLLYTQEELNIINHK